MSPISIYVLYIDTQIKKKCKCKSCPIARDKSVEFAIGLVFFVLNLPDGQVLFFGEVQMTEGL